MGKRLEKYHRLKKEKKRKRRRFWIFSFVVIFLLIGLITVDNSLREMMCIKEKGLFEIMKIEEKYDITLIGKDFCLDSEEIKTFLKGKANFFIDEVSEIFNTIVGKISGANIN